MIDDYLAKRRGIAKPKTARFEIHREADPVAELAERKRVFAEINARCIELGNAWLTSIPGEYVVRMECLAASSLPAELAAWHRGPYAEPGFKLDREADGARMIGGVIVERFTRDAMGELVALTEGSTLPVAETRAHAGSCPVRRFTFDIG